MNSYRRSNRQSSIDAINVMDTVSTEAMIFLPKRGGNDFSDKEDQIDYIRQVNNNHLALCQLLNWLFLRRKEADIVHNIYLIRKTILKVYVNIP
jgi:hypothetical protein